MTLYPFRVGAPTVLAAAAPATVPRRHPNGERRNRGAHARRRPPRFVGGRIAERQQVGTAPDRLHRRRNAAPLIGERAAARGPIEIIITAFGDRVWIYCSLL